MIVVRSADEALKAMVELAFDEGYNTSPRGMKTWDKLSMAIAIEDPRHRIVTTRSVREGYAAASLAWNLAERNDVETICAWNENGRRISDDAVTFHGANYGQRWSHGIDVALKQLQDDPDTRRAWVPIWQGEHEHGGYVEDAYVHDGKDVPCTLGFGLRIIGGHLIMQTVMRSQSIVGVFPYDVFLFTALQELLANELGVKLGRYEHICLSAHIYEREHEQAMQILEKEPAGAPMLPIKATYSEAKKQYVHDFGRIMDSATVSYDGDPIVDLMVDNAPRF